MKRGGWVHLTVRFISHYFSFFFLVAFVITCCVLLMLKALSDSMGLVFTDENISAAAKLTFLNVIFLSLVFTVIDEVRRRWTVVKPAEQIAEAAERVVKGDFGVRVPPVSKFFADESFNDIISSVNSMIDELSGVETLRTDFIANVSHEMKTPLSVMQNYGTLLCKEGLDEQTRIEYARVITDSSRRLADMMTNILKLNRLENQQIFPTVKEFDLGEQLCESLLQFESLWEKKGIEIETDIEEGVTVCADGELMMLAWNNLFSNAFKFTDDGGRVSLSLHTEGSYAVVRIADTGCGMSAEVGAHIFEKFYQGDTSHSTQGNGLGLALVKRVVDIADGEIGVESTVGVGTAFTVKIRRATDGAKTDN